MSMEASCSVEGGVAPKQKGGVASRVGKCRSKCVRNGIIIEAIETRKACHLVEGSVNV